VLYGTTREFLEHFGLRDLEELPPFEPPAGAETATTEGGTGEGATATVGPDARDKADAGSDRTGEERGSPSPA
jgi:hypothetical protein